MLGVKAIHAFSDNYIWAIHNEADVYIVDPGDAQVVLAFITETQLQLAGILITHHHHDHTGGIEKLRQYTSIPVYGPANPSIKGVTTRLKEDDQISILGSSFKVLHCPGHTLDHLAYFTEPAEGMPLLFCGDTLFSGGCGRLFEGTAEQMQTSLDKFASLPENTQVFCAHEYTRANLIFAKTIDPNNQDLQARIIEVDHLRERNLPTIPSTIAIEKKTNPFMRTRQPAIINSANQLASCVNTNPSTILAAIRTMKDSF